MSITYNQTRYEIIRDAFSALNIYAPSQTPLASDLEYASAQLNKMIKAWNSQGIHLWKKKEAVLFLQLNQREYVLSSSGDHTANDYIQTTLNANQNSGNTSLTLTSTTGILVGDHIGIILNNNSLQWTTVATVPNSTTVTVNAALTDDSNSGNYVYVYTTKIDRPLKIYSARRNQNEIDTPMIMYSYQMYFDLPQKTSQGLPTTWMYNTRLNDGLMYIWPEANQLTSVIKFSYAQSLNDILTDTSTPDFPNEWLEVLTMQLAVRLSHRYGKRNSIDRLKLDADSALEELKDWDNEDGSLYFQPTKYYYG